eukprot:403340083
MVNNQIKNMVEIKKNSLRQSTIAFLALYFFFEGLTYLRDGQRRVQFDLKIYNTEAYLYNKGLLLVHFSNFVQYLSPLIIPIYGLIVLLTSIGFVFFEDMKKRVIFIQILILMQLLDAFIVHNPIIENYEMRSTECKYFMLDFLIIFTLVMIAGFRD